MRSFFAQYERPLLVLDIANNHNGSVDHAKRIIDETCEVLENSGFSFAIKFQYRDLDTFIHSLHKGDWSYPYIKRFESTRLGWSEFETLVSYVKSKGGLTACTPFDEASVEWVVKHEFDILKVASASFTDWPLLERIASESLPIIASTAGADFDEIDRVASFFSHREKDFALMHCVAAYPTHAEDQQLNRIDVLSSRYSPIPVGYSTHEDPFDMDAVKVAVAKGARILERHVGVPTDGNELNKYSSSPAVLSEWVAAINKTLIACGQIDGAFVSTDAERESLAGLRRGVYTQIDLAPNQVVGSEDVFFAIPLNKGQVSANEWSKYRKSFAKRPIKKGAPLLSGDITTEDRHVQVKEIVTLARELFQKANVVLPTRSELEISHHYGLEKFFEYGLLMVTVVNRNYCKKILGILPGQQHPEQWHEVKEETFNCLYGSLDVRLNDEWISLNPGESLVIQPRSRHFFKSESGCVIEEISSTHHSADSFYSDQKIMENRERKTLVDFWQKNG